MRWRVSRLFSRMATTSFMSAVYKYTRRSQLTSTPDSRGFSGLGQSTSLQQQPVQGNPAVLPACSFCPVHIPDTVPARGGRDSTVEHMYSSVLAGPLQCCIRILAAAVDATDAAGKFVVPQVDSN